MRIMPVRRLILHMRRRYRNPPLLLLRRLVNLIKRNIIRHPLQSHMLRDRRRQRRLPMIDMPYRTHIHMRLGPLKLLLRHRSFLPVNKLLRPIVITKLASLAGLRFAI